MKLTPWARAAALALAGLALFAVFLAAKYLAIEEVMLRPWLAWLGALAAVAAMAGVGAALRARGGAVVACVILGLACVVDIIESPLAYELARVAERMPHPEGASPPTVESSRAFTMGHPRASVEWTYAGGTNVSALTRAMADELQARGWNVSGVTLPGGALGELGLVSASRGPILAGCTTGGRDAVRLACALSVA